MTPKEKAEELISKFFMANIGYGFKEKQIAKKNALISVDEIIKVLNPEHWGLEMNIAIDELIYWKNVKEEMEKL